MSAVMGGGIRTLDDIMSRCFVDGDTGCWLWRGALVQPQGMPYTHLPAGLFGCERRQQMSARKAAWLLAGKPLAAGRVVYVDRCKDQKCVNPEHLRAGSRSQAMQAADRNVGSYSDPMRRARLARYRLTWTTPVEKVRAVEASIAGGMTAKAAAHEHGLRYEIAKDILRGRHPHQRGSAHLMRGASVFALGGA